MTAEYNELAKAIVHAQLEMQRELAQAQKNPSQPNGMTLNAVFDKAPAWITLMLAACVGYGTLNGRISTCEYQNQISVSDRADLRRRLDKTGDMLAEVRTDLGEIKVALKALAERKR